MAKISMLIPDELLVEIDAQADGNRSSFMLEAALERARRVRREKLDREIIASLESDDLADAREHALWETALNDGLE
jgi:uncharacterized protein (DUF1778 family)